MVLRASSNEEFPSNFEKVCLTKYSCVKCWDKPWLSVLRESVMSPNREECLRWHSTTPQICAEKLLLNLLHHHGAGGQVFCMHRMGTKILWFYSVDLILLTKSWSKWLHWSSHPLTSAMSNVKHLLLVITAHLFKIFLVSWADRVAKKRWSHFEYIFFLLLFCLLWQEGLNCCSSGHLELSIFIYLKMCMCKGELFD